MKRKNGFTLVELLAVIVILAIIALIATPLILNVIENAKKGASESSALGYIEGIEKYIVLNEVTKEKDFSFEKEKGYKVEDIKDIIEIKGEKPKEGWVCIGDKKEIEKAKLKINNYVIKYEDNKATVVDEEIGDMDCSAGTTPNEPVEPAPPEVTYTCKRAIKLHTGICNTNGCSDAGERITFGNEEVTDGTLTSGDAFDCDVNGDGTFDDKTERFYYVTDLDNETVVLIYYNNVTDGNPYNVYSYAYHSDNVNNMGPVTAASQLPTTEKWSNVSLKNPIRQITNNEGGTTTEAGTIATFNYSKYAARLLTYQEYKEAKNGCTSTGGLNSCNYLRENTRINSADTIKYGYWLETPQLSTGYIVYTFVGTISSVSKGNASNTAEFGVRPVIEVPKSEIEI